MRVRLILGAILLALLVCPFTTTATAQVPPLPNPDTRETIEFEIIPETTYQPVALVGTAVGPSGRLVSDRAVFDFSIRDNSVDPSNPYATKPAQEHIVEFRIEWLNSSNPTDDKYDRDRSWAFQDGTGPQIMYSGQTRSMSVTIVHDPAVRIPEVGIRVIANMSVYADRTISKEKSIEFFARIVPAPSMVLTVVYPGSVEGIAGAPLNAKPDSWITVPVEILNADLYKQHVSINVRIEPAEGVDPAAIATRGDVSIVLEPQQKGYFNVSIKTPKAETYYGSTSLQYVITGTNVNQPSVFSTASGVVTLQGFYISTPLVVVVILLLLLLVLLILVLIVAKRYYDENILGKPIPPWRIPEEAKILEDMRKTDPRTFYITRYFLMVEEYESALNWFYGYKKRTKKTLQREAKSQRYADRAAVLKTPPTDQFDRRAERIKRKMRRRQERRRLQLEAELNKLQKKVDQHYEEDYEKDHEKWEKKVEKLKAKANKPWFKAHKKWERDVEKIMAKWEKPFAKEKAKTEKAIEKAKEKYAKQVKKKDKETWRAWNDAVLANEKENKIRAKEGRDPLPEPVLVSEVVGPADLPKPFKEPPKPKLPSEPAEPTVKDLPPEPKLEAPTLDESHYAKKARRERKKSDRKVRRLERKLERMLAKNERDRVKYIAKSNKKREKLLRKSHKITQPTLMERLFRNTPEHRERRAHKKLLKALARERVKAVEESEKARIEVLIVDAKRREAELLARLMRQQAEVRKSGAGAAMRAEQAPELASLKETNREKVAREKAVAAKRVQEEKARAEDELKHQLTEELVKERAERERLQDQKAAQILAKAEAKKQAKTEAEAEPEEPPAEKPKPSKKTAPAKRGKK